MNAAEKKLEIFRKLDSLSDSDLEKVYNKLVLILNSTNTYPLSKEEKAAIDKALEVSEKGNYYSREEVMKEAREKYPKLKFK